VIFWIICLVVADQAVKLIIVNFFWGTKFYLIEPILGFRPVFNDQYSYFNTVLKLNLGILPHTIILILAQAIISACYGYYKTIQRSGTLLIDVSYIFGQSALICVFCGFYFWKAGILDFIDLYLWIVDFKDIYLNCFVILFGFNYFKNWKDFKNPKFKTKDYLLNSWTEFKQFLNQIN
jgi:signal peptidase II